MSQKQPPRRGLGRGLGALIPTGPVESPESTGSESAGGAAERSKGSQAPSTNGAPSRGSGGGAMADSRGGAASDGRAAQRAAQAASSDQVPSTEGGASVAGAYFAELPLRQITPNARQPRQVFEEEAMAELVHSIREIGLLQPIVVRRTGPEAYELVMGERRWRASQKAGLEFVPAIVRQTEDNDMLRDALLENLHRSQLNPLEEAAAYGQMLEDFGCTHEDLARRIGRSRPQISNTLRLLKLSPAVQRRVAAGVLSAGHARSLLSIDDSDLQDRLAQRVVAEGISVRGLEEIVALGAQGDREQRKRRNKPAAPGLAEIAERLSDRLETRVKVDLGKAKGRITVEFATLEDLRRIVDMMDPSPPQP